MLYIALQWHLLHQTNNEFNDVLNVIQYSACEAYIIIIWFHLYGR